MGGRVSGRGTRRQPVEGAWEAGGKDSPQWEAPEEERLGAVSLA